MIAYLIETIRGDGKTREIVEAENASEALIKSRLASQPYLQAIAEGVGSVQVTVTSQENPVEVMTINYTMS